MNWKLSTKLQCWIRIAQVDNHNKVAAFDYCANTVVNTRDAKVEFVRKGQRGFRKLWVAYFQEGQ